MVHHAFLANIVQSKTIVFIIEWNYRCRNNYHYLFTLYNSRIYTLMKCCKVGTIVGVIIKWNHFVVYVKTRCTIILLVAKSDKIVKTKLQNFDPSLCNKRTINETVLANLAKKLFWLASKGQIATHTHAHIREFFFSFLLGKKGQFDDASWCTNS